MVAITPPSAPPGSLARAAAGPAQRRSRGLVNPVDRRRGAGDAVNEPPQSEVESHRLASHHRTWPFIGQPTVT